MSTPDERMPHLAPPSEDVVVDVRSSALPGEHRGGFRREMTKPVPLIEPAPQSPNPPATASQIRVGSAAAGEQAADFAPTTGAAEVRWAMPEAPLPRSAGWALLFGVLGLIVSFLVGWGFLIGLVGIGLAVAALRRPWESRQTAVWALCLSVLSIMYSAGWLWWASTQGPLFG